MKSQVRGRRCVSLIAVSLLLSASHVHGGASLRRGRAAVREDWPSCSCDCCDVVERRPDEVVAAVGIKCAPSAEHSEDVCATQCTPESSDQVLARFSEGDALDYQRFCFFECKPVDGVASALRTQCVALEAADTQLVLSTSGEALDPAVVYSRLVPPASAPSTSASLLSARSNTFVHLHQPAAPVPTASSIASGVTTAQAQKAVFDGSLSARTQTADTLQHLKKTVDYESALASRKAALGADPYVSITDLRSATTGAQMAELRAEQAAAAAEQALSDARGANNMIAMRTASSEVARVRAETRAKSLAAEAAAQDAATQKAMVGQ